MKSKLTFGALLLASLAFGVVPGVADVPPPEKHYLAARAALTKGDADKAKRELKLELEANPLQAKAHFLLASLLGREGDLDQAIIGFQRTMTLEPNNAAARYNLGTALLSRGEPVAAARQFEDAISIRPDHVPTYNNLGKAYFLAGIPELAVASYREALRRDPLNAIALKNLALLTNNAGKSGEFVKPPRSRRLAAAGGASQTPTAAAPMPVDDTADQPIDNDAEAIALRELVRDFAHVTVERRGGLFTLSGWTSGPAERKLLDRVLSGRTNAVDVRKNVLDLTTDNAGDPHRLLEVDTIIFVVQGLDSQSVGHNFLQRVTVNAGLADAALSSFSWFYSAAISYDVNIANVAATRLAVLARPHLTTLSGTPAKFTAGGDVVYKVSGTTSGDIKPYPFGTTLTVTPTLLRTRGEDGSPRIHVAVEAGRKTILAADSEEAQNGGGSTVFANVSVTSEAVLGLSQTLILTGLSQRESQEVRSGVPGLKSIPIIKYLFSTTATRTSDLSVIILLTPRDPAFWDDQYKKSIADFVEMRRALVQARQGTEEDMRRFKERYPNGDQIPPNRFASHFFLMQNSELYRVAMGQDLTSDDMDFELLGLMPKKKGKK